MAQNPIRESDFHPAYILDGPDRDAAVREIKENGPLFWTTPPESYDEWKDRLRWTYFEQSVLGIDGLVEEKGLI